jgi:hypothetical protein
MKNFKSKNLLKFSKEPHKQIFKKPNQRRNRNCATTIPLNINSIFKMCYDFSGPQVLIGEDES